MKYTRANMLTLDEELKIVEKYTTQIRELYLQYNEERKVLQEAMDNELHERRQNIKIR